MLQITLFYLLALTTGSFAAVAGRLSDRDSDASLATPFLAGTPTCELPYVPPMNVTLPGQPPNPLTPPDEICQFLCPLQRPCPKDCKKCAWNAGFACCAFTGQPKCLDPVPGQSLTRSRTVAGAPLATQARSGGTAGPTRPPLPTKRGHQRTGHGWRKRQDTAEITCPDHELPCPKECPKTCIRPKTGPCPNANKPTCPPYCPKIVVPCPKECPTEKSGCVRPQGVLCPYAVEPTCKPTVTITVDPANPTFCPLVIRPCPEKCPDSCLRPVGAPCPNIYQPWCPEDSSISVSATTMTLSTPTA
ncbi:hypothetical protein K450DRAFT_200081 [Umbelopsis ramanniana AG]|uniref:Uncharacterized protein n=1 Tax=Umbelopsis ramanniana AG TaxID=1314678 RepID=A0AAD5EAT6_UMBRA|nr:uncharacterized protein K450DRAFT_200081 [Umbelopsis ramanniana AG]KAI8578815.1 hypothetical protein K450DRAFT_200081 [Umbelopsis ramanniana AG]